VLEKVVLDHSCWTISYILASINISETMTMRYENVIVFGPTGAVGGAAALEASKRGAKVWLAMRDTSKAISRITTSQEEAGKFTRVKADLSDPESIKAAIHLSAAKAAFVYLAFSGGMKSAVQAMKEAGIEYVVFLSSFTIKPDVKLHEIPIQAFIPFMHAQGEIALEDIGMPHTALRPGSFASNPFKMSMDASRTPWELYVYGDGHSTVDNIVPNDIGRVAGAVLVDRPSTEVKEIIYLYGPTLMSELKACNMIKNLLPNEVKVIQQTPEEWVDRMRAYGVPPPVLNYLVEVQTDNGPHGDLYAGPIAREGAANVKKYSGGEPTSFEDFVKVQGWK
jgi:nucleoside-diphosphate-sugar epimerase